MPAAGRRQMYIRKRPLPCRNGMDRLICPVPPSWAARLPGPPEKKNATPEMGWRFLEKAVDQRLLPLPVHQIPKGCSRAGYWLLVGFHISTAGLFADSTKAESNLLLIWIHLNDLEVVLLPCFQLHWNTITVRSFRHVAESFNAFSDFNKSTELRRAQNLSMYHIANAMSIEEGLPNVWLKLLDSQRKTPVFRLHSQNHSPDLLAFFQDFRRMFHTFCPAQIADVDQTVNSILNLNKSPEICQVPHPSLNHGPRRISLREMLPGVLKKLLHPQGDTTVLRVDGQNDGFNFIARFHDL